MTLARSRRRRRRRALTLVALALAAVVALAAFRLAGSGTTGPKIGELPGSTEGAVAAITEMSSEVTRPKGGAQLDAGKALARVAVAEEAAKHVQVSVAWTNVSEAEEKVLTNPNAQLSIGLYHPIHSGKCTSEDEAKNTGKEVDAPRVTIKDEAAETCGALDEGAGGSPSVSTTGKLLLAKTGVNGFLDPSITGQAGLKPCSETKEVWCQPSTVTNTNTDVLYLVASIVTPGGIPQGQQLQVGSLKFFIRAKRLQ